MCVCVFVVWSDEFFFLVSRDYDYTHTNQQCIHFVIIEKFFFLLARHSHTNTPLKHLFGYFFRSFYFCLFYQPSMFDFDFVFFIRLKKKFITISYFTQTHTQCFDWLMWKNLKIFFHQKFEPLIIIIH